ncbi:MAG: hypothetical protein HY234_03410 [Acidobacteria bacterium]|nr:hypothetical protein [Acidobacteriota bacterium]
MAAQQPARDPQAAAVLTRAVAAMGGSGIAQMRDCRAEGVIQAAEGSWLSSGAFVWKNAGAEFRYENQGKAGPSVFVSGQGRPAVLASGKTTKFNAHVSEANFPQHLAALVLFRALSDPRYKLVWIGLEPFGTGQLAHVRISLEIDEVTSVTTVQDWYFDPASGLPLRVEYRLPANSNALSFLNAAVEFSDFRMVSGVAVPFQIMLYEEGQKVGVAKLNSVVFNAGLSPSEFHTPAGGVQ